MNQVLAVLESVHARLSDPKRWMKGAAGGRHTRRGVIPALEPFDCWCLGRAISLAVEQVVATDGYFCALRSTVESELLLTIEQAGGPAYPAVHQFNDDRETTHSDVLALLAATAFRLEEAA